MTESAEKFILILRIQSSTERAIRLLKARDAKLQCEAYERWKNESVERIHEDETGAFEAIAARAIVRMRQSPNGWTTEYILAAMRDAILALQDCDEGLNQSD